MNLARLMFSLFTRHDLDRIASLYKRAVLCLTFQHALGITTCEAHFPYNQKDQVKQKEKYGEHNQQDTYFIISYLIWFALVKYVKSMRAIGLFYFLFCSMPLLRMSSTAFLF